tara:strand:- start:824 stop:1045 length:222 start_codon:yes stop_codon:yes gene_type:complete
MVRIPSILPQAGEIKKMAAIARIHLNNNKNANTLGELVVSLIDFHAKDAIKAKARNLQTTRKARELEYVVSSI